MTDYQFLVENSIAGMFVYQDEHFVYVNEAFAHIFGYSSIQEFLDSKIQLKDLMPHESYITLLEERKKREQGGAHNNSRFVIECYNQDGHLIYVEVFAKTQTFMNKSIMYGTVINATESVTSQKKLSLSEQRYRSLFEFNSNLIYSFDLEGNFDSMNPMVTETLGYSFEELIHIDFKQFIYSEDLPHTMSNFMDVIQNGKRRSYETRIIHKSGEIRHTQIINLPIYVDNQIVGVYGIARDITELKNYIQEIERLAYQDHLTGLPNRRHFEEKYNDFFDQRQPIVLAIMDLDGFKTINDTLGHDIGDELLKVFSELLKEYAGGAFIARLGGDEFALVYPSDKLDNTLRITEELLKQLKNPIYVKEFELFVSATIGISSSNGADLTPQELFKNADIALYNAKADGKRRISVYSQNHDIETLKKFILARDIQKAITDKQFYIEYQPKFNLMKKKVTSVEALLRWSHPSWGSISPDEFIPIAEESGLIVELGQWVLETAIREMKPLVEEFHISVSVNVSVIQIMNKDFTLRIKRILEAEIYDPAKLELEITETALYNSEERMKSFLADLKALGVRVSLDDFGKGYSSLSFIQKYDIDIVKLDKSFINSLSRSERNAKILSGTLALLQTIGAHVIAEGIETMEQYAFLKSHHCEEAQGYLFSKPIPASMLRNAIYSIPNSFDRVSKYEGTERRRLFRIKLVRETKLDLTIVSIKGHTTSVGYTAIQVLNLGPGALSFSLAFNLPVSKDFIYKFSGVLNGEPLSIMGYIAWREEADQNEFIYGISFIYKDEKEQNELIRLLNQIVIKNKKNTVLTFTDNIS
ncbi:sensor domain-containing protein [Paenibacillus sp. sgz302251]|uniref:sensor domain-containing protein n=1 Tax=Paenibacillus sp. sgz302251 TaxID=3414493 RepID=UPI003C7CAECB